MMTPWALPASDALFEQALKRFSEAGAVEFAVDAATPPDFVAELRTRLRASSRDVEILEPREEAPASALGRILSAPPSLEGLAGSLHLERRAVVIDARRTASESALLGWRIFLKRFAEERTRKKGGLVLALVAETASSPPEALRWSRHLRRSDCMIWADAHLASDREGLSASLASALAVELCGWRLDLAKILARATPQDLAAPLAWLERRTEAPDPQARPLNREDFFCPLFLRKQDPELLRRRIWRAHLASLFPMLEDQRIKLILKHRKLLRVDERLQSFGVRDVEEIELGGLRWQLQAHVGQNEQRHLEKLVALRNSLAHRRPAEPEHVSYVLRLPGG